MPDQTTTCDERPCRQVPIPRALRYWARHTPDAPALTFLRFSGRDSTATTLTYVELSRAVDQFADVLRVRTSTSDRVAVLLDQSLDYVIAFLGCLTAGRVAVPLYAVDATRSNERIHNVLADCLPAAIVVPVETQDVTQVLPEPSITQLMVGEHPQDVTPEHVGQDDDKVSYLQYTSGSTRSPAGVQVTARNLAVGSSQLSSRLDLRPGTIGVSWLPYFHDMGLLFGLGAILQNGAHGVHMSPLSFVQRPVRWLRAISDYRANVTVVPNFALDHAVSRTSEADRQGLDLSSLTGLGNGSEPVRAASLEAFTKEFTPFGFTASAHRPGYGLAEATLLVTSSPPGEGARVLHVDRETLTQERRLREVPADGDRPVPLVSAGTPVDQNVAIVDPRTCRVLDDGVVGEVWVQGANVCAGYFEHPGLSAETFSAQIVGRAGTWLRTGDLGSVSAGHLYLVGRLKDLIIVGGKNHYPEDIEGTVHSALGIARPNGVAAFAHLERDAEQAVLVIEVEPRHARDTTIADLVQRTRAVVSRFHELALHDVVLVRPGSIPKTTSGKIQRRACAALYGRGEFRTVTI